MWIKSLLDILLYQDIIKIHKHRRLKKKLLKLKTTKCIIQEFRRN